MINTLLQNVVIIMSLGLLKKSKSINHKGHNPEYSGLHKDHKELQYNALALCTLCLLCVLSG
jgi:hypothetical protein